MGPLDVHPRKPRTQFLQRTLQRAVAPRWAERARHLGQLENLIYRAEHGFVGVPTLFLLSSIARKYPLSMKAMQWEICWGDQITPVELAEMIELELRGGPPRHVMDRGRSRE
jgi:hypothetical protein